MIAPIEKYPPRGSWEAAPSPLIENRQQRRSRERAEAKAARRRDTERAERLRRATLR